MRSSHGNFSHLRTAQQGFTLGELLVVLAITGILAALAGPSFSQFIKNQRMKSMASDLNASLTLTRSEAIKRNTNVTMSPATAGAWQSGWQIADPTNAGANIEVHGAFTGVTATGPASVTYLSSGRAQGTTAPAFDISAPGSSNQYCVSVDLSGRPNVKASGC
ncbi:MAG: GspH/FimT family pseudopilin [Burkholderiales bacterium]